MSDIVVADMNKNLRTVYEAEVNNRNLMTNNILRFHRDRGKVIAMVKAGKSLDGKTTVDYGPRAVEVLSESLGLSVSYAYKLATFYDIYSEKEKFEELMDYFDEHKYHLTWSHFNLLVHVNDSGLREQLIHKAVEDNMPVAALRKEISANKIKLEEDGFEPDTTASPVLSGDTAPKAPLVLEQHKLEDEEDEEEEEEESSSDDRSPASDVSKPGSARTLKALINHGAKFGDKLVDLVGDLAISLSDPPSGKLLKEIIKGIDSAKEVLDSISKQTDEYVNQLETLKQNIKSVNKNEV